MLRFKTYVENYYGFDVDDTLVHHPAKIHVKNPAGKRVQSLSTSEFNNHKLHPGHSYDFSEFKDSDHFYKNAKPIHKMIGKARAIANNIKKKGSNSKVDIVTARADFDKKEPVLRKLTKMGLPMKNIHLHRTGNRTEETPALRKQAFFRDKLKKEHHEHVHLYDDSKDNLDHFLKLKDEFPNTTFHAHHVQPDGSVRKHKG